MHEKSSVQPFGDYLRELRSQRRMDLKDVSEICGVAVARLMALESGSGSANRQELRQLARAFRMSGETMLLKAGQLRLILD